MSETKTYTSKQEIVNKGHITSMPQNMDKDSLKIKNKGDCQGFVNHNYFRSFPKSGEVRGFCCQSSKFVCVCECVCMLGIHISSL